MADLRTTYMGMELEHPIVPSASPLSRTLEGIQALEQAGAPAIVLYSLFEEQVGIETGEFSDLLSEGALSLADANLYFPQQNEYIRDPEAYVNFVRRAKESVGVPIIASLNGTSRGSWLEYAERIEEAGADGLEINLYFIPTTDTLLGTDVEQAYLDVVNSVRRRVDIPLAVKLSPFFSAFPSFALQLDERGADALVLFNRFYQPDIDVETQEVKPHISLSKPEDILLPLRWVAILYGLVDCSLALTSGVHSADEVLKAVMAGADVANVCSVLLEHGVDELKKLVEDTESRMQELGMGSIAELKGSSSLEQFVEPGAFERASYIKLLQSYGRVT